MSVSHKFRAALKEMSNWKSDAKLEDSSRYFYETEEVERLRAGDKSYVIGRKGTGKTAIAHHISGIRSHNVFSSRLSLKNFPWNILYPLKDKNFTRPNEYITLWKYVVYISVLKLMMENEAINPAFRSEIRKLLPNDIGAALEKTIKKITGLNFSVSGIAQVIGISSGFTMQDSKEQLPWVEKVGILEAIISKEIDNSNYYLIFDDLDEDYKYQSIFETNRDYIEIITGLFKAVQSIRADFSKLKVFPVVFLRNDIFDLIQDNDKTKFLDLAVKLYWTEQTIKPLLAFRIEKSKDKHHSRYDFGAAWNSVFSGQIGVGNQGKRLVHTYDWITRRTMLRPRDYIKYMQLCAEHAVKSQQGIILSDAVTHQVGNYSDYLRSELQDEMSSIVPYISDVFDCITKL